MSADPHGLAPVSFFDEHRLSAVLDDWAVTVTFDEGQTVTGIWHDMGADDLGHHFQVLHPTEVDDDGEAVVLLGTWVQSIEAIEVLP